MVNFGIPTKFHHLLNWGRTEKPGKLFAILLLCMAVVFVTLATWWFNWRELPFPEGLVQANGRIEGDHYSVSSKWPGRIVELLAREGDVIEKGQVLAQLDDAQSRARLNQSKAALAVIKAQLMVAQTNLAVFKKNVPLKIDTAKAALNHAAAEACL